MPSLTKKLRHVLVITRGSARPHHLRRERGDRRGVAAELARLTRKTPLKEEGVFVAAFLSWPLSRVLRLPETPANPTARHRRRYGLLRLPRSRSRTTSQLSPALGFACRCRGALPVSV